MKIWVRYLAGTILGIALGVLLPLSGGDTYIVLQDLASLVLRVGRIFLFPMVFFAAIVATDELRDDGTLLRTGLAVLAILAVVLLLAATVGAVSIVALQPQRIPPMVQEGRIGAAPSVISRILETIPANSFRLFVVGDNALLMIVLFGMLVGFTLRYDREITSPVSLVADSANRILFRLNAALTGVVGIFLIVPTAMMVVLIRQTGDLPLFGQFMLVVSSAALFFGIVAYPVTLYLLDRERSRPLAWLRRMVPAGLAALAGGDIFFSLATYSRVANEDLAVPRRVGGVVPPLVAIFGRAGTALVSVAAFILVIRSYTALEIGLVAVVQLIGAGVVYALLLGRTPAGAVLLLLSYLAAQYGRGMEESYLILLPVMPLLERIGAWLDMMTIGFVAQVMTRHSVVAPR